MTCILYLQAKDSLDHGRWLNALIKGMVAAPHLACVDDTNTDSVSTGRDSSVYSDVYEDFVKESSTVSHKTGTAHCEWYNNINNHNTFLI